MLSGLPRTEKKRSVNDVLKKCPESNDIVIKSDPTMDSQTSREVFLSHILTLAGWGSLQKHRY